MTLTEKIIKEFEEKSKILFTRGGLAVLLDYPPHDMVLDEEEVKKFLLSSLHQVATEAIEAVKLEEKKTYHGCITHRGLNGIDCDVCKKALCENNKQIGYNNAISEMEQKAKEFLENL